MIHNDNDIITAFSRMVRDLGDKPAQIRSDVEWLQKIEEFKPKYPALSSFWSRLTVQYGGFPLVSDKLLVNGQNCRRIVPRGSFQRRGFHRLLKDEVVGKMFPTGVPLDLKEVRQKVTEHAIRNIGCGPLSRFTKMNFGSFYGDDRLICKKINAHTIQFLPINIHTDQKKQFFKAHEIEDALTRAIEDGDIWLGQCMSEPEWRDRFRELSSSDIKLSQAVSLLSNRMSFIYGFARRSGDGTWTLEQLENVLPVDVAMDELIALGYLELGRVYSDKKALYKIIKEADPKRHRFAKVDFKIKHCTSAKGVPLQGYKLVPEQGGLKLIRTDR